MKDKEYGVKLKLDISDLKDKLGEAKKITEKAKKEIEEPLRKVKITSDGKESELTINTNKVKKQLKETAEEFEKRMENIKPKIFDHRGFDADVRIDPLLDPKTTPNPQLRETKGEAEFWKMFSNMEAPVESFEEFNEIFSQTNEETKEMSNSLDDMAEEEEEVEKRSINLIGIFQNFDKSIAKGVNSIKRYSLSLLGVRSIYSLLSRATHAYMAQDESFHNKTQANWIALGSVIEPIVTRIINLFTRLIGYVNVFVRAFTGGKVDLISKAMSVVEKKSNKTKNSLKSLNQELASFDEITNLNFDKGGGDIDEGVPGIEDYLKEMQDLKLNPKIVEILEKLADKLRNVWDWIVKNKDKLEELGKVIATVFVVTKVSKFIKKIKSLFSIVELAVSPGGAFNLWALAVAGIAFDIAKAYELIQKINELTEVKKQKEEASNRLIDGYTKYMGTIKEQMDENNKALENHEISLEQWQKRNKELYGMAEDEINIINQEIENGRKLTKEQREELEKQVKAIEKVSGKTFTTTIKANLSWTEQAKKFFEDIGIFVKTPQKGGGGGGRGFAKGNVAYEPTYAEFGEYSGANTNPEITAPQNIMRQTLYEALSDALPLMSQSTQKQGDIVLNVNGREFARATYSDYQREGQRIGSSNIAIRRG